MDCSEQPVSVVYGLESLEDMLETLNTLLVECIDRHALLWRVKVDAITRDTRTKN